jgi:integrase
MPDPYRVAALLTTFAGLRGGETFALSRRHLRRDETGRVSHIRVERSLLELPGQPIAFGPPKTGAGLREIAVPDLIGEVVASHLAANVPIELDALLFTTQAGRPVGRSRRSAIIVAARTQVGIPNVTWHTLRHTGLTLAASVPGVTVRNLMDRGGHSTPRAALIYQHTAADADALLAAGLGRLIDQPGMTTDQPRGRRA